MKDPTGGALLCLALTGIWIGCAPGGPEPIVYGEDVCAYCNMVISDQRFGAELVTDKGRIYKFDAVECLAAYYQQADTAEVGSVWVTDLTEPGRLIPAEAALYLQSPSLRSPMGLNLAAFADRAALDAVQARYGGETLSWTEVLAVVKENWLRAGAPPLFPEHMHPQPD